MEFKCFLDKNEQYPIVFNYDEKTSTLKGALKVNTESFHTDFQAEGNLTSILYINLDDKKLKFKSANTQEGNFVSFETKIDKDKAAKLSINLRDQTFQTYDFSPPHIKESVYLQQNYFHLFVISTHLSSLQK